MAVDILGTENITLLVNRAADAVLAGHFVWRVVVLQSAGDGSEQAESERL